MRNPFHAETKAGVSRQDARRMGEMLGQTRNGARGSRYSVNAQAPSVEAAERARFWKTLLLCLLLPPIGIAVIWRYNRYSIAARSILTLLGITTMTLMLLPFSRSQSLSAVVPTPASPLAYTAAPINAFVNPVSTYAPGTVPTATPSSQTQTPVPTPTQITYVYAVRSGAKYYHSVQNCNGQSNSRSLTVAQAKSEGLSACSRCKPPAN